MAEILHIIHSLTGGGAARTMIATAKYSAARGTHRHRLAVLDLAHTDSAAVVFAMEHGMEIALARNADEIRNEMSRADIVQVNWWQHPEMDRFLRSDLPPCRLLGWFHVAADVAPQVVTSQMVEYFDFVCGGSEYTHRAPAIQALPEHLRREKTGYVIGGADFQRLEGFERKPHAGFNVGYIGTVNPIKMYGRFVPMHSAIPLPDAKFIVCGGDQHETCAAEARALGDGARFDFRGYVQDIREVLSILDVYGYPLCADTYAASELNLQEAMFAGIPPVVFPAGGIRTLVQHNVTGLVANSEEEYRDAIVFLANNPEERTRLGRNAQEHAARVFGAENNAPHLDAIYERLLAQPKRSRVWPKRPVIGDSGAAIFLDTLGGLAPEFEESYASNDDAVLDADQRIIDSSPLMRLTAILPFRDIYSTDPHMNLWAGLAHFSAGAYSTAAEAFLTALQLGLPNARWRVSWYLALCASGCQDTETAQLLLARTLDERPDFHPAREMLLKLERGPLQYSGSRIVTPQSEARHSAL